MTTRIANVTPFLQTTKHYPNTVKDLAYELNKSYIDSAQAINNRTISIFSTISTYLNGERYFINTSDERLGFRQLYSFTTSTTIPHNLNINDILYFTKIYGTFTDGTNWYPLPYVSTTVTDQIGITIDGTNINLVVGGTAPVPTKGLITLEWV